MWFVRVRTVVLEVEVAVAVYVSRQSANAISVCVVRETYRDSQAIFEHIGNLGETMEALFGVCDMPDSRPGFE